MKKQTKHILSLVLALALCLSLLPSIALAAGAGSAGTALPKTLNVETNVTWSAANLRGTRINPNTYNGKIQILIFFDISGECPNSNHTLQSLMGSEFLTYESVQVVAVGCSNNGVTASAKALEEYVENNGLSTDGNITYTWCAKQPFLDYMSEAGITQDPFPVNVVLDEAGHLRTIWAGDYVEAYYANALKELDAGGLEGKAKANQIYTTRIANPDGFDPSEELKLLNAHRASLGLAPFEIDASLQQAAMQRAVEIALYYGHYRPNDRYFPTAVQNHDGALAENIAAGPIDLPMVVEAWLDSTGHRRNIESASFKSIGLGHFVTDDDIHYWVQLFSKQKASGSYTDEGVYDITVMGKSLDLIVAPTSLNLKVNDTATVTLRNSNLGAYFTYYNPPKIYATSAASKNPAVATAELEDDGTVTVTAVGAGHTAVQVGLAAVSSSQKPATVSVYVTVTDPSMVSTDSKPGDAVPNPFVGTAYASTQTVNVDGKEVEFQCYALKDANGNFTNYIKLRDLAMLLNGTAAQFQVDYDGSVTITTKTAYTPNGSELSTPFPGNREYKNSDAVTKLNGQTVQLSAFVLTDDNGGGYTYYQLRDLGKALGFNVGWTVERGMFLETDKPYSDAD